MENWVQGHWNLETSYALLARTRDILGGNVEQVTGGRAGSGKGINSVEAPAEGPALGFGRICP